MQFTNLTADGSTAGRAIQSSGWKTWEVRGTFGGGTVTLEVSSDGGATYIDMTDGTTTASFTADGRLLVYLHENDLVRQTLAGSTSPDLDGFIL